MLVLPIVTIMDCVPVAWVVPTNVVLRTVHSELVMAAAAVTL